MLTRVVACVLAGQSTCTIPCSVVVSIWLQPVDGQEMDKLAPLKALTFAKRRFSTIELKVTHSGDDGRWGDATSVAETTPTGRS